MNINIGTTWLDRNNRECHVFDIYTTTSNSGAIVEVEYVSFHTFLGQRVEHFDSQTAILRGIARREMI